MQEKFFSKNQVNRIFGNKHEYLSIITSSTIATISFFYIFTLGSFFKIAVFPFQDRVTFYGVFDNYVISDYADHVIISVLFLLFIILSVKERRLKIIVSSIFSILFLSALLSNNELILALISLSSLPIIIAFVIFTKYSSKNLFNDYTYLTQNYLALIAIGLGLIGLFVAFLPIYSASSNQVMEYDYFYEIYLFFSSFSPFYILLLIACYPVKILIDSFTPRLKIKKIELKSEHNVKLKFKVLYLSFFIILSIFISLVPHLETINPENQNVSVDTGYYVNWVGSLIESSDAQNFMQEAFVEQSGGDRPVSLIAMYIIAKTSNAELKDVIEYLPLILAPCLVIAVYFLTREITSNDTASLIASFLTAISFQTIGGIYAGFFSNWFALIVGFMSFVFFFRFLKNSGKTNFVLYSVLMVLLLFSHVYTWSVLIIVMTVFLLAALKLKYYRKKLVFLLFLVIISSFVIDVGRTAYTGSSGGLEGDISVAQEGLGLEKYPERMRTLVYSSTTILAGQISNFIILTLGLYWLVRCNSREPTNIFLFVFLMVGIIPILFGNWVMQTRLLYDIPFQIPAAIALTYIIKQENGFVRSLPIFIWLVAISIKSVSDFYFVSPV